MSKTEQRVITDEFDLIRLAADLAVGRIEVPAPGLRGIEKALEEWNGPKPEATTVQVVTKAQQHHQEAKAKPKRRCGHCGSTKLARGRTYYRCQKCSHVTWRYL